MTRGEFISAVTKMYGDRYDCSGIKDENLKYQTNAPVKCSRHGTFYTTPYQLLHGLIDGCFGCYKEKYWGEIKNKGL